MQKAREDGRGEATRRRMVAAAVRVFGERGYHAVGTRELADAARVNQAAIPYYFGGKDGLHRAAAADVAAVGRAAFASVLERVDAASAESLEDRQELARLARAAFAALTRGLVGPMDLGARAGFVVREQLQPGPAFDVLYEGYIRELHEAITTLVAAARGLGPRTSRAALEAHALIGMALGFVVARPTLRRRLDWDELGPRRVNEIESAVVDLALGALGLPETTEVQS